MTSKTSKTTKDWTCNLNNRVALITGGGRGIGRAISRRLAKSGARVAICGRQESSLAQTCAEIEKEGGSCLTVSCDVQDEASVQSLFETITKNLGPVDILVNNAGIYKTQAVAGHPLSLWQQMLQINLTGAFLTSRAVIESMIAAQWGRIINISSISGRTGEVWGSAYSASKFGLIGLTQSLALEVAAHGITVNAICPGWVKTEMAENQLTDPQWCKLNSMSIHESTDNAIAAVPQMRFIEPEEVADLTAYLASEMAAGITGQSLNICGGLGLH